MKQPTTCRTADYLYLIPMILTGIIGFLFAYCSNWFADAIEYAYIHQPDNVLIPDARVRDLADIWVSQCNHYVANNGRFVVHFIVQIFCGMLGKLWFAIFNGLVWFLLPYLTVRFATHGSKSLRVSVSACALIMIMLLQVRIDPPFQINYIWTAAAIVGWLMIFFSGRRYSPWLLILIGIYSFLCGECNESFSIPICFAIGVFALRCRFRLAPAQWVAAAAFVIASVILIASPGNWERLGTQSHSIRDILASCYFFIPALLVPAICVPVIWSRRHSLCFARADKAFFVIMAVIANYSIGMATGYNFGPRLVWLANLLIVMAVLVLADRKPFPLAVNAFWMAVATVAVVLQIAGARKFNDFDNRIYNGYAASDDGIVYVPDNIFADNLHLLLYSIEGYRLKSHELHPGLPELRVRPESLRNLPADADTNMLLQLDTETWLMLQSRKHPAAFILHKRAFPGTFDYVMADRELDFDLKREFCFERNDSVNIGLYHHSWPLIDGGIEMVRP